MGFKQKACPKTVRTGQGRAVERVEAAQIQLLFSGRVEGLHLLGQVGRGKVVVHGHGIARPEEDKAGQHERKGSMDKVHCSIKDHPRRGEFRIHLRFEGSSRGEA
ncbi:hypothetical protein [Zoogloea sp.]|uniref:hypothetical protein n=1 Tax=Zoogloea sp. TaxID=49181 RepID=UPI001AC20B27|nr:hypothetical protein [Zoogloea sp.]MBN8282856.1 hypothetical protein [Zoogloea sp.]